MVLLLALLACRSDDWGRDRVDLDGSGDPVDTSPDTDPDTDPPDPSPDCDEGDAAGGLEYTADGDTVALYHFNEATGAVVACDVSGRQHHAALAAGSSGAGSEGVFGAAWRLSDGAALTLPDGLIGGAWTVEAWFAVDGTNARILTIGAGTDSVFELRVTDEDGSPELVWSWQTPDGLVDSRVGWSDPTRWAHVAWAYDGERGELYQETPAAQGWQGVDGELVEPVVLGDPDGDPVRLDELRISSVARPRDQIVSSAD